MFYCKIVTCLCQDGCFFSLLACLLLLQDVDLFSLQVGLFQCRALTFLIAGLCLFYCRLTCSKAGLQLVSFQVALFN